MEPHLMWMGQEAMGISLFDTKRKEFKGSLLGGHTGGVTCLASGDALDGPEIEKGAIPRRRAWSGSNDFTICQWSIETWHIKDKDSASTAKDAFVFDLGKFRVAREYLSSFFFGWRMESYRVKLASNLPRAERSGGDFERFANARPQERRALLDSHRSNALVRG